LDHEYTIKTSFFLIAADGLLRNGTSLRRKAKQGMEIELYAARSLLLIVAI
jgi:hypothetical protein